MHVKKDFVMISWGTYQPMGTIFMEARQMCKMLVQNPIQNAKLIITLQLKGMDKCVQTIDQEIVQISITVLIQLSIFALKHQVNIIPYTLDMFSN